MHLSDALLPLDRKRKFSTNASTSQAETSNMVEMKKALRSLASVVCLLTLLFGAATCAHAEQPKQSSCSHCPKRAPLNHTLPSCCSAQQQPPAVLAGVVRHSGQHRSRFHLPAPIRNRSTAHLFRRTIKSIPSTTPPHIPSNLIPLSPFHVLPRSTTLLAEIAFPQEKDQEKESVCASPSQRPCSHSRFLLRPSFARKTSPCQTCLG